MQDDSDPVATSARTGAGLDGRVSSLTAAPSPTNRVSGLVLQPPTISLPKGGGAVRGIGEKFAANPVTGTGAVTVPIALSPGRGGFGPQLTLSYDSGAGQSVFGLGWNLDLRPSSARPIAACRATTTTRNPTSSC
jgi:hypothetical protein